MDFSMSRAAYRISAAVLAGVVFLVDTLTPLEGAVAVGYVVVILLAARTMQRADVLVAASGSVILTISAYLSAHHLALDSAALRLLMSFAAISITLALVLQNQTAIKRLSDQARLLDLSHDMIFVRNREGIITFWNRASEETYGWSGELAIGRVADDLLQTVYSAERSAIEAVLLYAGHWEGKVKQRTRAGETLTVDARWVLQRNRYGEPIGVLESYTDITESIAAHDALVQSERRYRRMFDASRIGVAEEDWTEVRRALNSLEVDGAELADYLTRHPGFVQQARLLAKNRKVNPALEAMVGAESSSDYAGCVDRILPNCDRTFVQALLSFATKAPFYEGETEMIGADGHRIPAIFTITFPPDDDCNVLIFVIDVTERRRAQDALLAAQSELARAARAATLGELSASIAHEVNQPLAAIVTSGEAGLRWLQRDTPDLAEVSAAMCRVVDEGRRAGAIVTRIRGFVEKVPARKDMLKICDIIADAALLVERELAKSEVALSFTASHELPQICGDRVQLQQVFVNLFINAAQAMAGQSTPRHISVAADTTDGSDIVIAITDTGPGIATNDLTRLFEPFFTTKHGGMGMGLAICRTTMEAHGGQMTAESSSGLGATFRLRLPAIQAPAPP
ncbi:MULTISPECIES: ATP-binding protein [unclassified Afipia]|uniref:PAS domain-containing sensor histidine kinase n=1 Tax=unclassified Afipia TaxID=2642050 RepID=UPI0004171A7F|nr:MULTISPECIES: ATP-binding protein [unclassified Afipia]